MNTEEIMETALRLVGFDEIPEDSQVYVSGENIRKVLFAIDVGSAVCNQFPQSSGEAC